MSCDELTERYIREFHADMTTLRCLPPTLEPRATRHIDDIVALIQRIMANGHAYALPNGDVYFEVATLPGYGRLSGRDEADNRAGERVTVDARKRGAADFALWKVCCDGRRVDLVQLTSSFYSRALSLGSRAGTVPGGRVARDGTSSAVP